MWGILKAKSSSPPSTRPKRISSTPRMAWLDCTREDPGIRTVGAATLVIILRSDHGTRGACHGTKVLYHAGTKVQWRCRPVAPTIQRHENARRLGARGWTACRMRIVVGSELDEA